MTEPGNDRYTGDSKSSQRGGSSLWQRFCRMIVRIFYRQFEISGLDRIPADNGIILCANHVNALVDAVVLQASTVRQIRPLTRSGLFGNPVLRPVLNAIGAVPIYRRQDSGSDMARNKDSFIKCYEILENNEILIIFPEGQSHSDPHLHDLKTGAARIALGAQQHHNRLPVVIPVGLTFSRKGTFRGDVLVQYGEPIDLTIPENTSHDDRVTLLTHRIHAGLSSVTLNASSWEDIELARRVEKFFALRHGKYRHGKLQQHFSALQRLIDGQRLLLAHEPDKVRALISHLRMFERLCNCCGIRDYHLTLDYRPTLIVIYILRTLGVILIGLPLAIWGMINSAIPYLLTRHLATRMARGLDQYDTTKVLLGLLLFTLFWALQITWVFSQFGGLWMALYAASLFISAPVAVALRHEYRTILANLKVFFMFLRKKQLREYLKTRRQDIEAELAHMVRIAKRLSRTNEVDMQ